MHAIVIHQKTKLSLWYWSHTLQRKVMLAWFSYSARRREKAERYSRAMEAYRNRLLTAGVKCWIQYATAVQDQRLKEVLQLQTKGAQAIMGCVRRCAMRWREVCRRRRLSHGIWNGTSQQTKKDDQVKEKSQVEWSSLVQKLQIGDVGTGNRLPPRRPSYLHLPASPEPPMGTIPHVPDCRSLSKSPVTSDSLAYVGTESLSVASCPSLTGQGKPSTPTDATYIIASLSDSTAGGLDPSHLYVPSSPAMPPQVDPSITHQTAAYGTEEANAWLSDENGDHPTLQTEVALMRCEVMKFYHLKTSRRSLQEQMLVAVRKQDKTQLYTLQQQLDRVEEQLKTDEPKVRAITARIQNLLSTCA